MPSAGAGTVRSLTDVGEYGDRLLGKPAVFLGRWGRGGGGVPLALINRAAAAAASERVPVSASSPALLRVPTVPAKLFVQFARARELRSLRFGEGGVLFSLGSKLAATNACQGAGFTSFAFPFFVFLCVCVF